MDIVTNASPEDYEEESGSSEQTSIEEVEIDPVSFWTFLGCKCFLSIFNEPS